MNELKKYPKTDKVEKRQTNESQKIRKRKKRKKRAKKLLLIIIFIFVILGTLFIIRMNENGWTYGGLIATLLGHDSSTVNSLDTIYIVVTGESQNLTDSIMVCAYNPKINKVSLISIPRDTFIGSNESKATASDKINTVYARSPEKLLEKINNITGLNVKYYVNIDTKGLRDLIDAIGGVYFDVPIDMDYDDPTQNLHIHLKAGYQLLDGDKAEQVVRFRHNNDGTSYPASYGDNDIGRMRTQREFIKVLLKQVLSKDVFRNLNKYIKIAKDNVTTNFNMDEIKDYVPYIVDFNFENLESTSLPGTPKKCNGVWLYIVNKKEVKKIVENKLLF